jgi:aldose 1-epimerase
MRFTIRRERRPTTNGLDGTFVVLADDAIGSRAEIWPALGFNCVAWATTVAGKRLDLLYAADNLLNDTRPTRSGIPILFPFPNRIRQGKFTWNGKDYALPCNDSSQQNAIHGYACRHPWRVVEEAADDHAAWVTAEFLASVDAPGSVWPGDYRLRASWRLEADTLRFACEAVNPGSAPLPFGLGLHPYLRVLPGCCMVEAPVRSAWELTESLPTGRKLPLDPPRNLARPRRYDDLLLDDVLSFDEAGTGAGLRLRSRVWSEEAGVEVRLSASPAFRELVVFTPPHRRAICLEPYTCITDAIRLQAAGVDAGLRTLPPGETFSCEVRFDLAQLGEPRV